MTGGFVLPNGDCLLLRGAAMIFSATIRITDDSLVLSGPHNPLPQRCSPQCVPPSSSLRLLHGREQLIAKMKAALQKRRSSVFSVSAAPTDLYKIFEKTMDQRQRDELFDRDRQSTGSSGGTKAVKGKVDGANKSMSEAMENMQLRGTKLKQGLEDADKIHENAENYRRLVKQQKEKLKKRNARWGIF
jgi:hypothetical protein